MQHHGPKQRELSCTSALSLVSLCRWEGDGGSEDEDAEAVHAHKAAATATFLKSALTASLLSVTNTAFKEVAMYAHLPSAMLLLR